MLKVDACHNMNAEVSSIGNVEHMSMKLRLMKVALTKQ